MLSLAPPLLAARAPSSQRQLSAIELWCLVVIPCSLADKKEDKQTGFPGTDSAAKNLLAKALATPSGPRGADPSKRSALPTIRRGRQAGGPAREACSRRPCGWRTRSITSAVYQPRRKWQMPQWHLQERARTAEAAGTRGIGVSEEALTAVRLTAPSIGHSPRLSRTRDGMPVRMLGENQKNCSQA